MSLTETTILAHVGLNLPANTIEVRWDNIIQRDGETISRVPHRKAYSQDQAADFATEVEGAVAYMQAMGWST
jgi:hypothetical protein